MATVKYATPIRVTPIRFGDELYKIWKSTLEKQKVLPRLKPPSVLAVGEPGIGKSVIVKETAERIAKEYGYEHFVEYDDDIGAWLLDQYQKDKSIVTKYFIFHDLRLTEVEPQEILGIPDKDVRRGTFRYSPPLWVRVLQVFHGVLFLDELLNVQRPDIMSAAYPLLLDRRAGFIYFNNKVFIVAAGNPPEYSALGQPLPTPAATRVAIYYVTYEGASPDEIREAIGSWIDWMMKTYDDLWSKNVSAFLLSRPEYFSKVPKTRYTLEAYPCPRSWTFAAVYAADIIDQVASMSAKRQLGQLTLEQEKEFYKLLDDLVLSLSAFVGDEAASLFRTDLERNIVPLEVLLKEPSKWANLTPIQQLFTAHYIAGTLISYLKAYPVEKLVTTLKGLGELLTTIESKTKEYYEMIMAYLSKSKLKSKLFELLEKISPEHAKEVVKAEIRSLRDLLKK